MRKYSSNLAFVDLLFNLLIGFTCLFIIAFMLINPIAKKSTIDPPVIFIIELLWDDNSKKDIDLYVKGPDNNTVYFNNRDGSYMILERDDLGIANDTYMINNEEVIIQRNYEMITFNQLPKGEYVVNVHYYSGDPKDPEKIQVKITSVSPFKEIYFQELEINYHQEKTIASFSVDEFGKVYDLNTNLDIPLRRY